MTTPHADAPRPLAVTLLSGHFTLCRLAPHARVPVWMNDAHTFLSVTRTPDECSIMVDSAVVPASLDGEPGAAVPVIRDFRALRVDGPLALGLTGVLAALGSPLAAAKVAIFPIATFDTDYLFVRDGDVPTAVAALRTAGITVRD